MKVVIITEGSARIGFGHITRCISLYEVFEEHGDEPFCIVNGDPAVTDLMDGRRSQIFDWTKDMERLFGYLNGTDIIIIDSYMSDMKFYETVSKKFRCGVYIDDIKRLDYPKGVVLNGSILAEKLGYPKREGVRYLLGAKYAFLRKEFRDAPKKKIANEPKSILVTFGGDDIRQMTALIITMLRDAFPGYAARVIIGKGFQDVARIERLAGADVTLTYYPDAEEMKRAMREADIAISAGGQTLYELARLGLPTIAIGVADNQVVNLEGWEKAGFIAYAGWYDDPKIIDKCAAQVRKMMPYEVRRRRSQIGQRIMDGKSHERLYDAIANERCLEQSRRRTS